MTSTPNLAERSEDACKLSVTSQSIYGFNKIEAMSWPDWYPRRIPAEFPQNSRRILRADSLAGRILGHSGLLMRD
jgi:hypothetical protein